MLITSRVIVKLILLYFNCSISLAHEDSFEDIIQAERTESLLGERSLQDGETLRELDLPSAKIQTVEESFKSKTPESSSTKALENDQFIEQRRLSREERLQIQRNWKMNKELSILNSELDRRLSILEYLKEVDPSHQIHLICRAIQVLKENKETLGILKQLRFLELGKTDLPNTNAKLITMLTSSSNDGKNSSKKLSVLPSGSGPTQLPPEVNQVIRKKALKNVGNSMVNRLKSVIETHLPHFNTPLRHEKLESTLLQWWKCALKTVDFLFKNEFADRNVVRKFFQGSEMMKQVIRYAELRFNLDIGLSVRWGSPYLTEHWYWSILHESFKALSKKDEMMLNALLLMEFRHNEMAALPLNHPDLFSALWEVFLLNYDIKNYLIAMEEVEYPWKNHTEPQKFSCLQSLMTREVESVINLAGHLDFKFLDATNNHELVLLGHHLYYLLDFIDRHISPGIVNRNFLKVKSPNFDKFGDHFNLMKLDAKVADLELKAGSYHHFIQTKSPSDWFHSSFYKSKFVAFLIELTETFDQLKEETWRLRQKLGPTYGINLEANNKIQKLERKIDSLALDLNRKLDFFKLQKTS